MRLMASLGRHLPLARIGREGLRADHPEEKITRSKQPPIVQTQKKAQWVLHCTMSDIDLDTQTTVTRKY